MRIGAVDTISGTDLSSSKVGFVARRTTIIPSANLNTFSEVRRRNFVRRNIRFLKGTPRFSRLPRQVPYLLSPVRGEVCLVCPGVVEVYLAGSYWVVQCLWVDRDPSRWIWSQNTSSWHLCRSARGILSSWWPLGFCNLWLGQPMRKYLSFGSLQSESRQSWRNSSKVLPVVARRLIRCP